MNNQTIVSVLLSNNLFGKGCIVKDMGDYIEVDTIHAGKVAVGASKYLEGGWSYSYGHYMWQISDAFQEYKEIHRGPFSCNLYSPSEISRMVSDIEKEYIRREKYKCSILVLDNPCCLKPRLASLTTINIEKRGTLIDVGDNMRDATKNAYTTYHCDEVIDEIAYRLTRDNWYGYKQFHDHSACVVESGKQIELYFHPYTGYQALVIADGVPTYYSIKWKDYTGDVSHDADQLYTLVIDMVQKYDRSLFTIQKGE